MWLVVDGDGVECCFGERPYRVEDECSWYSSSQWCDLPPHTIEKLIGRKLTWEDEPVEYIEPKREAVRDTEYQIQRMEDLIDFMYEIQNLDEFDELMAKLVAEWCEVKKILRSYE